MEEKRPITRSISIPTQRRRKMMFLFMEHPRRRLGLSILQGNWLFDSKKYFEWDNLRLNWGRIQNINTGLCPLVSVSKKKAFVLNNPKYTIICYDIFFRNSVSSESKPGWVRNQLQNIFAPTDNKLAMKLFGSKKALMKERVRQKAIGHWIIHPCSSFR